MKKEKVETVNKPKRPAFTVEGRENQLISMAVDLAEKQLREGTASSQVITHFLKLGTTMAQLERERMENENQLLLAKTKALSDAADMKQMYAEAIAAMKRYSGNGEPDEY